VHELHNLGLEVICLDARHARAALEMQIHKTDQNDAEGLAQIVRTGWYRSVHVKSFESHRARALLGARTQLIGMTTRLSNHIRGVLKLASDKPGKPAVGNDPRSGIYYSHGHCRDSDRSFALPTGREFSAWLGLTPRQNSSGGKDRLGHISKMGNGYLRSLIVVGATAMIRYAREKGAVSARWINALLVKKPARLVSVAAPIRRRGSPGRCSSGRKIIGLQCLHKDSA